MDPQSVLKAPLDDIIFDGRNQAYGAYFLRKIYNRHLFRALLVAFILTIIGTAAPLIANYISSIMDKEEDKEVSVEVTMTDLEAPPEEEVPPPPPPPEEPPPVKSTIRYVVPEPKKDEEVVNEEPPPPVEEIKDLQISDQTQKGDENGQEQGLEDAPPAEEPAPPPVVEEERPSTEIFKVVEQMPEFEGGTAGLLKYLYENMKYPAIARENGIEGKVIVQFVVDEAGNVSQAKVVRGIGGGCDKEAIRVVETMSGKWKAGKQRGRPVKVWFTLPVNFQLQ